MYILDVNTYRCKQRQNVVEELQHVYTRDVKPRSRYGAREILQSRLFLGINTAGVDIVLYLEL